MMKFTKFVLAGSLMTFMSLSEVGASDCFLSVKTSGDFNPALVSEISFSLISQYLQEVKPIPSSGISADTECVYDVSVISDAGKTFVSFRGEGNNSFGDSSLEGTDGFQQSIKCVWKCAIQPCDDNMLPEGCVWGSN